MRIRSNYRRRDNGLRYELRADPPANDLLGEYRSVRAAKKAAELIAKQRLVWGQWGGWWQTLEPEGEEQTDAEG